MRATEIIAGLKQLPFISLADLLGGGAPLILAPHQDDESLGCGGLIACAAASGLSPCIGFLTDGSQSHPGSPIITACELAEMREQEAREALVRLGAYDKNNVLFLRLPDSNAPHAGALFEKAVASIASIATTHGCTSIFAPWRFDPHCDHVAAHEVAAAVARRCDIRHFSYPVWGWLLDSDMEIDQPPHGWRFDISECLSTKRQAIDAHVSQRGQIDFGVHDPFEIPPTLLKACTQPFEVFLDQ